VRQTIARRYHLHLPGFLYVGLTVVVGLAAVNRQNNLLFWILGVMLAALLISGLVSGVMMQSLRVKRLVAGNGVVGEPLTVRYAVTNRSRLFPAFGIHLEERPVAGGTGWPRLMAPARAWVMHLGPGETVHGEAVFWPRCRGKARLDELRIWTTFPFGIVKKSITISQPQHTLIYPLLYELRRDVLSAVAPQGLSGTKISPRTGAGDDYYGMREFRPGDQIRQIAWKRSACLDQLVCLERTRPTPPRLRVVVNLTTPTHKLPLRAEDGGSTSARRLEERAISLAASIVHAADREGYEVGLTLAGTGEPSLLIRRGHWHRSKIMAALAGTDLETERAPHEPTLATHGERAGQIVIHPHRVEPAVGRDDALHLTAGQLDNLVVRAIGWDPDEAGPEDQPREAAA
jgi:uncharacterized protein (DUF58 family)